MKKLTPKFSKDVKYTPEEMGRYLGALNEVHGETLKGIKENFIIVNKKLDSHSEMMGALTVDVSVLKTDVSTLKSNMTIVKEDLSVIKSDLKRKVDYDDFLSLVRRVQKIEAKI